MQRGPARLCANQHKSLQITVQSPSSNVVLRFSGYLDIGRYPEFRTAFQNVEAGRPVLVDLRDVTGVDSVFLSELLLFRRRHRPAVVAVLIAPQSSVAKVFSLAEVGTKLNVFSDEPSATAALDAPALDA